MSRLSFSYTLLASFLLIAAILGTAALGGLLTLEDFAARSREGAGHAVGFSSAIQQLGERTVDMERSARQFLVLGDPALLERFQQARQESMTALEWIAGLGGAETQTLADRWIESSRKAGHALRAGAGDGTALQALGELQPVNEKLAAEIRRQLDAQSQRLLDELDGNRSALAWHLLVAVIAAFLLAALTGWWVLRPLNGVEQAIEGLGDSRLDEPIAIGGPADLRRVGRRLDWLRVRLADLESNRTRVLRHVSHELKTPLASLREGIALLRDGVVGSLSAEQREVVAILEHNSHVLQQRIEGLLGYNAAIFEARSLKRRPVALRALAETVLAEQQLPIQHRGLRVVVDGDAPPFPGDPDKLRVVLANLVANAISFSPQGGTIRLHIAAEPRCVRIDCIDDGPGAPQEEAERIFEPFFQGSRQPPVPRHGSGLGLSIVREFVAAHGGTVGLLPTSSGAHFRVELPNEA